MSDIQPTEEEETPGTALQAKADFLNGKIDSALKHVRQKRKENQRKASTIRLATLIFSSVTTILLGLQVVGIEPQLKNIAFVFGALVTLMNALEPFFNFRALWVEHEAALWKLHRLKDKTDYYLEGITSEQLDARKLGELQLEYQGIWDELSKSWIDYRKQYQS